jgi:hypothetical protein
MALISAVGNLLATGSQNRNARRAAETSQANTEQNVALAREIYGSNRTMLSPFMSRGNVAGDQINALLGLGGSQQMGGPQPATVPAPTAPPIMGGQAPATGFGSNVYNALYGLGDSGMLGGGASGLVAQPTAPVATAPATPALTPQQAANNAFDIFRNSTGYQFRLGEGLDATTSAYAGIGGLQSGAALRGITEYGQNFASNEFGNYLGALSNQQAVGAGSASALAGVGQNFAGTVIGANNMNAANQMNAQLARQNPFANALGSIGGAMQGAAGTILGFG